ncbi:MAG: hypothetical protein WC548_04490 [Candidatus Pacearchaeota archaeon]
MAEENNSREPEGRLLHMVSCKGEKIEEIKLPTTIKGEGISIGLSEMVGSYSDLTFTYFCEEDEGIGGGTSRRVDVYGIMRITSSDKIIGSYSGIVTPDSQIVTSLLSSFELLRNSAAENQWALPIEFIKKLFEKPYLTLVEYHSKINDALGIGAKRKK